jgi:hypothetical protein
VLTFAVLIVLAAILWRFAKGVLLAAALVTGAAFVGSWLIYYVDTPSLVRSICEAGYGTARCVAMYWVPQTPVGQSEYSPRQQPQRYCVSGEQPRPYPCKW